MRKAYHPYRRVKITVVEYIKEFGNKPVNQANDTRPRAICPYCRQGLSIRASSTPDSIAHFAHLPSSGYCPSKTPNGSPYLGKLPTRPDADHARYIKAQFLENWKKHYNQLNYFVKNLFPSEFISLIQIANQQRIWEYARLEECYLPYILATLADFEPQKNLTGEREKYARKLWFRCWFDSTVTCYDDLWTERSVPLTFFRAWYNAPSGKQKYPKLDDMIDSYESEISDEFLSFEKQMSDNLAKLIEPQLYSMLNK